MAKKDYSSVPKPEIPEVIKLAIATYELEWWMRKLSRRQVREEIKKATSIDVRRMLCLLCFGITPRFTVSGNENLNQRMSFWTMQAGQD